MFWLGILIGSVAATIIVTVILSLIMINKGENEHGRY